MKKHKCIHKDNNNCNSPINKQIEYEFKTNTINAILPCGYRISSIDNESLYKLMTTLQEVNKNLKTVIKQISAHDYNISKRIK
jgi:hypothetical protein